LNSPIRNTTIALAVTLLSPVLSLAGPPLSVDDPGVLDPGQIELITAVTAASFDTGKAYQAPVIDVSLGLIEDYVQASVLYSYVGIDPDDAGSDTGWGNPEIGVKWRLLQTDRWQVALAPAYAFGVTRELAGQGIGHDTNVASIPVLVEYSVSERWRVNTSLAYLAVEDLDDELAWGVAGAYTLNGRWELLAELSGASNSDFDDSVVTARAGVDFAISDKLHLLFSAATGVSEPRGFERLHYDYYLALQSFF
jgi:outer membrane putative beta-barrel porin/alpha-amylase